MEGNAMEIKFGLFSCDSHAQLDRDAWTKRLSKQTWGDRIPQIVEVNENGQTVDRWMVNGKVRSEWVCNCPAAMEGGVERGYYPRRWEEVPKIVYDPAERLKALDDDRVDGEVLYPNGPVANFAFLQADAAFELACVQAYNDALAEWREVSDRYVPVAIIPYMSEIDVIVAEVERCVKRGHRGVVMLAEPAFTKKGLKRMNDPFWEPLWASCQELGVPMHWHGSSGLVQQLSLPKWDGFSRKEFHTVSTSRLCATPAQLIPNLIFSGILDRYPRLKIAPVSQVVASWIPKAAGIAYAAKMKGEGSVTLCTFGDGATSQGEFHEGVSFAAVHRLPVVFVCENNSYAISVPIRLQMANPDVADRAAGYGLLGVTVDGTDVPAAYKACREAVARARRGEGPTLIDAKIWRINSHTSEDNQLKYRTREELDEAARHDPITRFGAWLIERGWITQEGAAEVQAACDAEASEAADWAEQQPDPLPEDALKHVFA